MVWFEALVNLVNHALAFSFFWIWGRRKGLGKITDQLGMCQRPSGKMLVLEDPPETGSAVHRTVKLEIEAPRTLEVTMVLRHDGPARQGLWGLSGFNCKREVPR